MNLTQKQKDVLADMRKGTPYYFNPITNYRPYTKIKYGTEGRKVHGKIMESLTSMGLVEKRKSETNSIIHVYHLTETGSILSKRPEKQNK